MKHTAILIVTLLANITLTVNAQTARLYTSADGLANSHVHDIFQDSKGFIWISTENGLSRFDGMKFTNIRFDRNKQGSIASNTVRTVFEDSKGCLWVGTSAGLQTFDTQHGTFTKINLEDWSVPDSDQHILSIVEFSHNDKRKIAVASSGYGIYVLDADSLTVDHDIHDAINRLLPSKFISQAVLDSKERLWITTANGGMTVLDINSFTAVDDLWEAGMSKECNDIINTFVEDTETGNIYIGTLNSGVLIWDAGTGKIRRSRGDKGEKFSIMSMIKNNIVPR